jgi:hypothetical protein
MKHVKLYLTALLFAALGITGCDDNWDTPPLVTPEATITANTTILELKQAYWFEDYMGVDTIGTKENGDHIVIKGRVVSSDESGNIYKNMVIDDGTAAITLSIDANSLYNTYRFGQEIVIDATDMYIGNYQGLQQLGTPEYNAEYGEVQMARMPLEFFQEHAQLNGLPEPTLVDTLVVPSISALPTTPEGIIAYQSKLVRFDNVQFDDGGKLPFSESEKTVSRMISDGTASLTLRNSGYANFYNRILPEGTGSVVGILGYYRGTWQLTLRSYEDCIFNGEVLPGTKGNPYTVSQAIEGQGNNSGWVKGYIVGAVAPNKETVSSNSDIEWAAPFSLPNTLVIAESADVRDYTKCLVINLPQNSELRRLANLADNANNFGAEILLKGTFANLYGMAGIKENAGTTEEFDFTPVVVVSSVDENFDSYSIAESGKYLDLSSDNLLGEGWSLITPSGDKDWSIRRFDEGGTENNYITCSGFSGTPSPDFDSWLITPAVNIGNLAEKVLSFRSEVNGYGSTTSVVEVYVMSTNDPETANLTKLDPVMPDAPATGYSAWTQSGNVDLSGFSGIVYIGFRYYATPDENYATWCIDDIKIGVRGEDVVETEGNGTEAAPFTVSDVLAGAAGDDMWVTGYIVGFSNGSDATESAVFSAENARDNNILIAGSANETDIVKCVCVALPSGDVRNAVNLKDNAGNLGKKVSVQGDLETLYGIPGVRNTSAYKF